MGNETLIIGDVHGCIEELDLLLREFGDGRDVVFVGDLVAKGPDSHAVVKRARKLNARAVLGNHDARALSYVNAIRKGKEPKMAERHLTAFATLTDRDFAWLETLPYVLKLPEHDTVVVHGGLRPGVPLRKQRPEDMMNLRSLVRGEPSYRIEGKPWASQWRGPAHVVFGHDAIRGLQVHKHATGLDTGCVYGGALSAYLLPEAKVVSVKATRAWCAT